MKRGFTLLEALIALAIIGIVLVITVPQLVDSFNKKTYAAGIQKVYIAVSEAIGVMMSEDRARNLQGSTLFKTSSDTVDGTAGTFIKKYLAIQKDCGKSMTPCFASSYKNLKNKSIETISSDQAYCAKLKFGGAICVEPLTAENPAVVYVDVNGQKKPNIAGRDYFVFNIYSDFFVGEKDADTSACKESENAAGCFELLKSYKWVMDY